MSFLEYYNSDITSTLNEYRISVKVFLIIAAHFPFLVVAKLINNFQLDLVGVSETI